MSNNNWWIKRRRVPCPQCGGDQQAHNQEIELDIKCPTCHGEGVTTPYVAYKYERDRRYPERFMKVASA